MKIRFLFIFFITTSCIFSQQKLQGIITSKTNVPLEGASVYLNNTTIGTITSKMGNYSIDFKEGNYELIISYLGYKTLVKPINTSTVETLNFSLEEEDTFLDEVQIRKTVYDDDWYNNLSLFKRAFLGKTKLASTCKILNPKTLHFEYNSSTNILTASTKEPLKIKHNGLGYMITYDLVDFKLHENQLFFSGYTKYINLNKKVKENWTLNRTEAYNGSKMDFYRSILKNQVTDNGVKVDLIKEILNPERPHDSIIEKAKLTLSKKLKNKPNHKKSLHFFSYQDLNDKRHRSSLIRRLLSNSSHPRKFSKGQIDHIVNDEFIITSATKNNKLFYKATIKSMYDREIDSLTQISMKSSLKKYLIVFDKRNVSVADFVIKKEHKFYLNFPDLLRVSYMNEAEEDNYRLGSKKLEHQVSMVRFNNVKSSRIDNSGILIRPFDVIYDGYWAFEAFANMLPLDYKPK